MKKTIPDSERERRIAEDLWLNYFNRYLRDEGMISEKEFTRMTELIARRKQKAPNQKEA
jgi:hypothetical protein